MDFTRYEINEDNEKNEDEMFYSFAGDLEKADSNTNTDLFANILLLNGDLNDSDKKSSERCLSSNKDSKEEDKIDKEKEMRKQESFVCEEQKKEIKKQEKNNNNVSLLQSFLKPLKDTIMPSLNRMGILGSEKVDTKVNQQNNKTTNLEMNEEKQKQKFKSGEKEGIEIKEQKKISVSFVPSVDITSNVEKAQREKGENGKQILVLDKIDNAGDNQSKSINKKYRIKSPDQVFEQLELEKSNNQGKNEKSAPQTVKNNINTFKAKLQQNPNFTTDKDKESPNINSYRTVGALSIVATSLKPVTTKNQTIISACLVRLPRSSNNHSDQNYYKKYKYELAQNELIINNNFYVSYADITKIKVISNEYNRPQIKVTYNGILSEGGMGIAYRQTHKSQLQNVMEGDDDDHISSTQLVFYLCQTYEVIFMIFSWIILSKTKKASGISLIDVIICVNRICQPDSFDYAISGMIYKKSKYRKNWDKRYCQIENFELKTYRESQKQVQNMLKQQNSNSGAKRTSATFEINSLRQLWTRFDLIDHKYIVMKMFQKSKSEKIQIAIPLTNYCDCLSIDNWMIGLFSLLKSES